MACIYHLFSVTLPEQFGSADHFSYHKLLPSTWRFYISYSYLQFKHSLLIKHWQIIEQVLHFELFVYYIV